MPNNHDRFFLSTGVHRSNYLRSILCIKLDYTPANQIESKFQRPNIVLPSNALHWRDHFVTNGDAFAINAGTLAVSYYCWYDDGL